MCIVTKHTPYAKKKQKTKNKKQKTKQIKMNCKGSIPYIRTVEVEDSWDKVQKLRYKHWTDDYEYTKPWEVDDGQWKHYQQKYAHAIWNH